MCFTTFQNEKTPFQPIKTRSSKSRKIDIFPKGLTHGFGPKMAILATCFFQAIQGRKMSFTIFQNEKTPFQAIKTRSSKSRKIDIFPKGLTHGFGPKMAIFTTFFFFQGIQARKMSFTIFQNQKTPFQAIKTRTSKSRKIGVFFWTKMEFFGTSFFQAKQARKMSFTMIQNEKTPLYPIKTRSSKSRKIGVFLTGLTHRFWTKMACFGTSFFQAKQARKMSFTIIQNEKTPFQAIKTRSSKSQRIAIFPKGLTHGFGTKMAIFLIFFQAKQARKMSFTIFQTEKNAFLGYKNEKIKKWKN